MSLCIPFLHFLGTWGVFLVFLSPGGKILSLAPAWKAWLASGNAQDTQTLLIPLGLSFAKGGGLVQALFPGACNASPEPVASKAPLPRNQHRRGSRGSALLLQAHFSLSGRCGWATMAWEAERSSYSLYLFLRLAWQQ